MRRLNCPWCNQVVDISKSDQIRCVNGRGMYKTEIYAHRSCYERSIRRKSDGKKVGADDKENE